MWNSYESDRSRIVFIGISATVAVATIVATREVLLPFVLALVLAYVLTPAVSIVERARLPRWGAVLAVYVVTLGGAYGFFAGVTPRLVREALAFRRELPGLSVKLRDQWVPAVQSKLSHFGLTRPPDESPPSNGALAPTHESPKTVRIQPRSDGSYDVDVRSDLEVRVVGDGVWRITPLSDDTKSQRFDASAVFADSVDKAIVWGQRNTLEVLRVGSSVIAHVSRSIFIFFMTLMLAAYLMITREKVFDFFRVLVRPDRQSGFDRLLARVDRGLAGVVRGQLIICAINGVLTAIGFSFISLKYWPILSVVAAIMSIIPIFGSILSAIPAVAIGLTQGIGTGLFVLLWILGIHQVEANLLNPKIYGIAAKIHPVLVIFSLLVGEHFFSLWGALLAVPCMSIVQNVFLHFRQVALGRFAPTDTFIPPPPRTPAEMKPET